jgi:hypothetical protein
LIESLADLNDLPRLEVVLNGVIVLICSPFPFPSPIYGRREGVGGRDEGAQVNPSTHALGYKPDRDGK